MMLLQDRLDIPQFIDVTEDTCSYVAISRINAVVSIAVAIEIVEKSVRRSAVDCQQQVHYEDARVVRDTECSPVGSHIECPCRHSGCSDQEAVGRRCRA